jgi:hypothetical protein
VPMLTNVARAICETARALTALQPEIEIFHIDTCEAHIARPGASPDVLAYVRYCNDRRFLCDDLILGRIDARHPLYGYLTRFGFGEADARWFAEHAARIDVRGLDYYPHSEREYYDGGSEAPAPAPFGFAGVAEQYRAHFAALLPDAPPALWLTETNIRGYHTDRVTWLKYMAAQARDARALGFCWFPFIDSTGWGESLLRVPHSRIDPVGIYLLDEDRVARHESILSDIYGRLAQGALAIEEIPAFRLRPPVSEQLRGFAPQMEDWEWRQAA